MLMPGLSDAHWHMVFAPNTMANLQAADTGPIYANAIAITDVTLGCRSAQPVSTWRSAKLPRRRYGQTPCHPRSMMLRGRLLIGLQRELFG